MKPVLWFIGTAVLVCAVCGNADYTTDLVPGDGTESLGVVNVWNDAETLYVEYDPAENWYFTNAKVTVNEPTGGNGKKGNGGKNKVQVHLGEDPWTAEIDISSKLPGDTLLISAHAIIATNGGEGGWTFTQGELAAIPYIILDWGMPSSEISVSVEGENLVVQFTDMFGMPFNDIRLYVGDTPIDLNMPELYPYQHLGLGYVLADEFVIPLADLGVTGEATLYIAAEGTVGQPIGQLPDGSIEYMDFAVSTVDQIAVLVTGESTPGTGEPDEKSVWAEGDDGSCKGPKGFQYVIE
jgi:hypothetical protein